ncbi:hypothetical protein GHT06_007972 [Daphnia sinensis]|uniref:Uncharacterized protein n=1 Tax=Daphnia sinensis TaxID=1820382 RepID=A0AAD5L2T3_9CRUS|nr:hypothetical protein GHT06_007972 [Daphnia sinensis]
MEEKQTTLAVKGVAKAKSSGMGKRRTEPEGGESMAESRDGSEGSVYHRPGTLLTFSLGHYGKHVSWDRAGGPATA